MITYIDRADDQTRVETGVVQFGNDWPGVFVRGDNALGYALALDACKSDDPVAEFNLRALARLLHEATTTTA